MFELYHRYGPGYVFTLMNWRLPFTLFLPLWPKRNRAHADGHAPNKRSLHRWQSHPILKPERALQLEGAAYRGARQRTLRHQTKCRDRLDGVGYGRPPGWTQFKPKQSGNPKGRPKVSSRKKGSIAQRTLDRRLPTDKAGGSRKSLRRVAFERIGEKASSGDIKSMNFLLAQESVEERLASNQFPVSN